MRLRLLTTVLIAAAAALGFSQDPLARAWQGEKKLILVITPDWNSPRGILTRYERTNGVWRKISEPVPVVVGSNGLAWDPALTRSGPDTYVGPTKHEGDGRSPAGVFQLKRGTFGFAPSLPGSAIYMPLTPEIECVDDPASRYYGRIVDRTEVDLVDWKSSEKMASIPEYRWGVVVNYNMDQPVPGDGSCIFLHQWSGPTSSTAGCTAMAADDIEEAVHWVIGDVRAVLVQLPEPEYQRLRAPWQLP
jgi:L,D-peptidoglycan transpeptidase YkuD (ErfK/YbiS/YcfS/YnhG family)